MAALAERPLNFKPGASRYPGAPTLFARFADSFSLATANYPTKAMKAMRPASSRLDLTRLQTVYGVSSLAWQEAPGPLQLDALLAAEQPV